MAFNKVLVTYKLNKILENPFSVRCSFNAVIVETDNGNVSINTFADRFIIDFPETVIYENEIRDKIVETAGEVGEIIYQRL